jgi:flagellar hook-length control protein FliK
LIDSASAPAQTIALPQIATPLSEALALRATTQPTSGPRGNAAPAQTSPAAPPAPPLTPRELAAAKAQAPVIEFRPEGGRPGPNRPAAASQSAEKAVNNPLPLVGASADAAPLKLASSADITVSAQQLPIPGSTSTSHVQHALVAEHAARSAPAAAQVGREIVRRFDGENTRFELRLDPPELGRIEVRLEVTRDHRVTAVVAADNAQALSELTRNARDLEQTLQSAGLELGENGLSFDLRRGGDETAEADAGRSAGADGAMNDDQPGETVLARPVGFERWRGVRLDLMV